MKDASFAGARRITCHEPCGEVALVAAGVSPRHPAPAGDFNEGGIGVSNYASAVERAR